MKYRLILLLSISFILNKVVFTQTCDCDIFPVKQACKKICGIKLLQSGTKEQLKNNLKLDDETTNKLISLPERKNKTKVEDFQEILPYKYYLDLENKFNIWFNNTNIIQNNSQGDNIAHDKIITNITYINNDSLGGIIEHPRNPGDYYHNARFYEIGGDIKKAKESYLKYFESGQDYIDPHLFYQELLQNSQGIEEAKSTYQKYLNDNPSSELYKYLFARLQDRELRILLCRQIYEKDSSYMPVIYQLALDHSSESITNLITSEKSERRKYLERFNFLNKNNSFFKYYIDKKEAIKVVEYMNNRLSASQNNDEFYLNNPVEVKISNQSDNNIYLSFTIKELCFEIFYRIDDDTNFISTGLMEEINPFTKTKYPNYFITLTNLSTGKHKFMVKYINLNHEMVGPYESEVNVLSTPEFNLKLFFGTITSPSVPKQIITNDFKNELVLTLANIASDDIFESITVRGFNGQKDILIYKSGKNLTYKGYTNASCFYFNGIKKGEYTLIFTLNFIDKTFKILKFTIEVVNDNQMHTFTGELI